MAPQCDSHDPRTVAQSIRSAVAERCDVPETEIKVSRNMASYTDKRRNSSTGETCMWVLVPAPDVPNKRGSGYYQRNPHLHEPTDAEIERAQSRLNSLQSTLRDIANEYPLAEYIGVPTDYVGYELNRQGTTTLNIRIQA